MSIDDVEKTDGNITCVDTAIDDDGGLRFVRYDVGKPTFDLVAGLYRELGDVNTVLKFGERKYSRDGWKHGVDLCSRIRNVNAALRHIFKYLGGERLDEESGLPHLAHAITNLLFALYAENEETRSS